MLYIQMLSSLRYLKNLKAGNALKHLSGIHFLNTHISVKHSHSKDQILLQLSLTNPFNPISVHLLSDWPSPSTSCSSYTWTFSQGSCVHRSASFSLLLLIMQMYAGLLGEVVLAIFRFYISLSLFLNEFLYLKPQCAKCSVYSISSRFSLSLVSFPTPPSFLKSKSVCWAGDLLRSLRVFVQRGGPGTEMV